MEEKDTGIIFLRIFSPSVGNPVLIFFREILLIIPSLTPSSLDFEQGAADRISEKGEDQNYTGFHGSYRYPAISLR